MRMQRAALPVLLGFLASAAPALAASTSVTTSSDGTTIVNGKPCRVVTRHGGGSGSNSSTVTAGGGAVSGSTTVSPGGSGVSSSVTTGSGGTHSSSAAGSDCVIYRDAPKK
jgi:hypothetical protein